MLIGYARCSTELQNHALQLDVHGGEKVGHWSGGVMLLRAV